MKIYRTTVVDRVFFGGIGTGIGLHSCWTGDWRGIAVWATTIIVWRCLMWKDRP